MKLILLSSLDRKEYKTNFQQSPSCIKKEYKGVTIVISCNNVEVLRCVNFKNTENICEQT